MRISGYTDKTGQKAHLFTALVQECQLASPGTRLSDKLRRKMEEFARDDRRDVVTKTVDGCAPLFLAAKNGSAEVADYLLSKCDAAIEQRGLFEVEINCFPRFLLLPTFFPAFSFLPTYTFPHFLLCPTFLPAFSYFSRGARRGRQPQRDAAVVRGRLGPAGRGPRPAQARGRRQRGV